MPARGSGAPWLMGESTSRDDGSGKQRRLLLYTCDKCDKTFTRAEQWRRHLHKHDENVLPLGPNAYQRDSLEKDATKQDRLDDHNRGNYDLFKLQVPPASDETELRVSLRAILEKKLPVEDALDELLAILRRFELPKENGESTLSVDRTKNYVMRKYLADRASYPSLDSGYAEGIQSSEFGENEWASLMDLNPSTLVYPNREIEGPISTSTWIEVNHHWPGLKTDEGVTVELPEGLDEIIEKHQTPQDSQKEGAQKASPSKANSDILQSPSSLTAQSLPEPSTSSQSATTKIDILASVLPRDEADEISRYLLAFFGRLVDNQLGIFKCQPAISSEAGQQRASDQAASTTENSRKPSAKRDRPQRGGEEDGESDEPDDGQGSREPFLKRPKLDAQPRDMIACPFMKRYPQEFSTWRTCVGPGFDGINRMKQHLKRKHFKERACWRCGEQFDTNSRLHDHMRAKTPCELKPTEISEGFLTQAQWDDITQIRHGPRTSISETWRAIYMVLFPDAHDGSIPGPYFEILSTSSGLAHLLDPKEYEAYLKQDLPRRVLIKLHEEFKFMAEHAKQRLVEICNEESLETLKAYMLQKGTTALGMRTEPSDQVSDQLPGNDVDFSILENFDWDLEGTITPDWTFGIAKEVADSAYGSNLDGLMDQ